MDYYILALAAMAGAVSLLVFLWFTGEIEGFVEDKKRQQLEHGATTFSDLYLGYSSETFLFIRLTLAILFFIIGFLAINVACGAFVAALGFFLPRWYMRKLKRERVQQVEVQLVEGLELLGNSLKSGMTLQQASELLVREFPPPISQEFSHVLAETRLGVEFTDALENMADRLDSTIVHILSTGVGITKRCGGDLTEIFQNIAATIREQANIEGKLNAVTAQGRFQGLILSVLPFALIVILWFIDRTHVETLFGYQLGLWALGLVIIMVGLAQAWISKLLSIDI